MGEREDLMEDIKENMVKIDSKMELINSNMKNLIREITDTETSLDRLKILKTEVVRFRKEIEKLSDIHK
jgi:prefoldin subunit 5